MVSSEMPEALGHGGPYRGDESRPGDRRLIRGGHAGNDPGGFLRQKEAGA